MSATLSSALSIDDYIILLRILIERWTALLSFIFSISLSI